MKIGEARTYKGYLIRRSKRNYVVFADKKMVKHSHMNREIECEKLIDLFVQEKIPKTKYWIMACMRLLDDCEYKERLKKAYEDFNPKEKCVKTSNVQKLRSKNKIK